MTGHQPPAGGPGPHVEDVAVALRQALRRQLRALVVDDRLGVDVANALLAALGEPELRRLWTVDVRMTFRCDVTAGDPYAAVDAAEALIADTFDTAGPLPVDVLWERRVSDDPTPGDLDRDNP